METQTNGGNGKTGKGFPKSPSNPDGYSPDERDRTLKGKDRAGVGRKDGNGIEETIKILPIKESSAELMKAFKKKKSAADVYKDVLKAVSKRSGVNAANLNKLVASSAKGNYADVRRDVDQTSMLFESVGEIAGGKESAAA